MITEQSTTGRPTIRRTVVTAPVAGLFVRAKGGFYHDGRFATLREVADHSQKPLDVNLTEADMRRWLSI